MIGLNLLKVSLIKSKSSVNAIKTNHFLVYNQIWFAWLKSEVKLKKNQVFEKNKVMTLDFDFSTLFNFQ